MDDLSPKALLISVLILLVISAFFSAAETAMMRLNRYRLRHLANNNHRGALNAIRLLERPDRLLGVILIGNTLANFAAASVSTLLALELYGEDGIAPVTIVLTMLFLIFGEVAPKTVSAVYSEQIALPSTYLLSPLLRLLYPLVWLVNTVTNGILRLTGLDVTGSGHTHLSPEELKTVVHEGAHLEQHPQGMLLSILNLNSVTVNDIMVPRNELIGIDIESDMASIIEQLRSSQHTRLPLYRGDIDNTIGMLHARGWARFLLQEDRTQEALLEHSQEPYFVPEYTPLQTQLLNFQQQKQRVGLVVNEYGDIQGIVTIDDILEEIVGEFTTDLATARIDIHPQPDGSYLIDGTTHLREINRSLGWDFPTDGPRTLSGIILERLEMIPEANVCLKIGDLRIEVVQIKDNIVRTAKVARAPVTA